MTAAHGQGPPRSTVANAMRAIVDVYAAVSDPTVFLIGERHLGEEGAPGRIIMVRGDGNVSGSGRVGDGNVARAGHTLTAYLWAAEDVDDLARYDAIDDMEDRFINAVLARVPGRESISTLSAATTPGIVSFGESLQITVTLSRGVPRDAAIWAAPITPQPTPDPMRPNGDSGLSFSVNPDATTNATR